MSTAHPDSPSPDRLVKVQLVETVEQVNARGPMTATAFEVFAADNGRCELIEGKVNMMSPAGFQHGRITWRIGQILGEYVDGHDLGIVVAAETGFLIRREPDTVRAADVAYVSAETASRIGTQAGFAEVAPDIVFEVRSPSDRERDVIEKTAEWLAAGTKCVVNVEPEGQAANAHFPNGSVQRFVNDDQLHVGETLIGWAAKVSEFFD